MSTFYGIDLGTSNCALAVAVDAAAPAIRKIPQIVTEHSTDELPLLPSAIYLPAAGEFPDGLPALPDPLPQTDASLPQHAYITGKWGRQRGALQPDRLIVSAKSWLCNAHVDRRAPLLPWQSDSVTEKWSPLAVSQLLLQHISSAAKASDSAPAISADNCVITVPASFDEAARALTLEAAQQAGIGDVTLLEEPQAAFYAWLENQGSEWRAQVSPGDLLLVCDIGGGTADFSLIAVTDNDGTMGLERIAVGEHLLLGGDNMDLALAHALRDDLEADGKSIDDWQFQILTQAVREAKEALLSNPDLSAQSLSVPSRSSRLLASTISVDLSRDLLNAVLLDGFLPLCKPDDMPQLRRSGGLREAGLPYAADAAISKHLARFLHRAHANVASSEALTSAVGGAGRLDGKDLLVPDAVLFNGGVFNAQLMRDRILQLLGSWSGNDVRELSGAAPDHAVAIGAAAYARLRASGTGLRIKAGTARSYYIGMEAAGMAVPGRAPKVKALCVAPQGMEEGSQLTLEQQTFFLYTGETSEFRFFQSEARAGDEPGSLLPDAAILEESAQLSVHIPPPDGHPEGEEVPVRIESRVTELGNLELFMVHEPSGQRWQLSFNVRLQ